MNAPSGITQSAKLVKPMDEGGLAEESEGSHQARVARHFSRPPQGGNADDYAKKALELLDIDAAYVYPLRGGVGTVHMACLHAGSGTVRLLNASERLALQAYIDEWRPTGGGQFVALHVVTEPVDIELGIATRPEPRYRWDWDDSSAPAVASFDANTWELVFDQPLPPTILPKHRLSVASQTGDPGATGAFVVVGAISGPERVILAPDSSRTDNPLGFMPSPGDRIHAGSDVAIVVREALLNGYELDGSRVPGLSQLGTANPDSRYGSWIGSVDPNRLQGHAFAAHRGVARAQAFAPTSIMDASDPEFPDHESIGLLVPGQVIVRRMD